MESKALEFGTFTLKSGRISPYFINMARALTTGEFAARTSRAYAERVCHGLQDNFDYLHGPAYKGIPLAALISCQLFTLYHINKRWGYDRKEEKGYGDLTEKLIVGDVRDGDRILLVDDVITTGKTKTENWEKLTASKRDLKCTGILVAVDRQEKEESGEPVSHFLDKKGFRLYSILKITEIFSYLHETPVNGKVYIDGKTLNVFEDYFTHYGG